MAKDPEQVWITGIGLVSSLGEGAETHWHKLRDPLTCQPIVDEDRFAPYPVHPLASLDFAQQIPRTSDQRQMERWQRIGVYAAGLALADAQIAGDQELLDRTDLSIAAGNGERDVELDTRILSAMEESSSPGATLNRELMTGLRPTLYLGQLSNLLAGNISIVHGATGSSRTFKGEEMAGVSAIDNAVERIAARDSEVVLAGGAYNAEREDALLSCELSGALYSGPFRGLWDRGEKGGAVPGSVGAFIVLEAASHARERGAKPYARITDIRSGQSQRSGQALCTEMEHLFGDLALTPRESRLAVLCGASGAQPATTDELSFIANLWSQGFSPVVRAWGSVLGHSLEAHFPAGVALAALSAANAQFFPPFDRTHADTADGTLPDLILVTTAGHWRGEAMALVAPVQ